MRISILLDYYRGSRVDHKNKQSSQDQLSYLRMSNLFSHNMRLGFMRHPLLPPIADQMQTSNAREIFNVHHMKWYIFDDKVLLTGGIIYIYTELIYRNSILLIDRIGIWYCMMYQKLLIIWMMHNLLCSNMDIPLMKVEMHWVKQNEQNHIRGGNTLRNSYRLGSYSNSVMRMNHNKYQILKNQYLNRMSRRGKICYNTSRGIQPLKPK